ncbi:hypothetical protein [Paraburkholderia sp. BL21I4N1]|uniref:hypothetical protein n=1 Tax=Paraburkholderia sp. BL21I4N1 TaxID=1938801 RepID=UPI000D4F0E4B|nr:hypothetical protein [Paraburkholderia sp. BL21I4N1]PQV48093.1 hypothetical protein B0G83_109179 [Paraburkholderia sp. BL21I4N1]
MRHLIVLFFIFILAHTGICSASVPMVKEGGEIALAPMAQKVVQQCGLSMLVPQLLNMFDQPLGFGCTGSYKDNDGAGLSMIFEYDPNRGSGGSSLNFEIERIGIDEKIAKRGSSLFKIDEGKSLPELGSGASVATSNCGTLPSVKVAPISGENWHGWIAEESFGKAPRNCKLSKEYTRAYRCVHLMIGNEKMVAQLDGVCLLRKKEDSLVNGFSYDPFLDMVKSIRFNED